MDASECRRTAVCALTVGLRAPWEAARSRLHAASPSNAQILQDVDEALLVLCLDDVAGLGPEGMERNVMYGLEGTYENRWMDKWNVIVTADGQSGMNWEHTLLDGHTMMEFFAPVADHHRALAAAAPDTAEAAAAAGVRHMCGGGGGGDDGAVARAEAMLAEAPDLLPATEASVNHLKWESVDADTEAGIEAALASGKQLSESCGVETLEFTEYGGSFIKGSKCSPDGFAQAAMQIAFMDMAQRLPSCYESVLAKSFKHGRVTVSRNMSDVIADNLGAIDVFSPQGCNSDDLQRFQTIVAEIGRICREAASAQEMDRPFLAYGRLAADPAFGPPLDLSSVVGTPAWKQFQTLDLCTSHCGKPPIRFFGYEPASADGFSIGYFVTNEFMQFSINHFDKDKARTFKTHLDKTLKALPSLFSK